ncbi:tRNA (adenosine(37)-N6)-threonylcarbamoyltransferase complex ATPase subunit type 1 TsaE [Pelagibacterales bacterium SAG-MED15]|nr:tRNA (adenosine(37)-N6)-threonylcarbamoyltransferase complex ATPase subunit type 1 TsaE [Pelagibacterales bacterium SAG-MED15]
MLIATRSSKVDISKESSTAKFARKFSKVLKVGDVVLLHGEIGAGKTTFIRYLINSLEKKNKVKLGEITSPTFSILNEYEIKNITIRHYDLFRIKNSNEIKNIGIYENMHDFITFIEWPDKIQNKIKKKYNLYFKYNSKLNMRSLEVNKRI